MLLLGCAQDVPLSRRDHGFARTDLELEREKYKTFAGSMEREGIDQQIRDHYIDHEKPYLMDGINLDLSSNEKRYSAIPNDDTDRVKQINELIEKQLHGAQKPVQTE
jgi:hypothetical protein